MRPTTVSSSSQRTTATATGSVRGRPQSAVVDTVDSPFKPPSTNDRATASSDELIKDLEAKVRKVVEQKRAESDKLRFAVAKKRDDVEKAKRILQDLLKDSGALGLHYDLSSQGIDGFKTANENQQEHEKRHGEDMNHDNTDRLQPITSISRRPLYSKHTNIRELEAKLERRAKEAHLVQRRTLVLEHIKKRLENERIEVAQATNQFKQVFADLTHETHELQKRDIAAAEAVSQVQSRLVQQKAEMAASVRKFKRELALRQKWAREKAKFEKYYSDQLQAATLKAIPSTNSTERSELELSPLHPLPVARSPPRSIGSIHIPRHSTTSPIGLLKHRRSTSNQLIHEDKTREDAIEARYREAFHRIGVDPRIEAIDPEEIIHICLSHEELRKELDAKHDEAVERIAHLREQNNKARSLAREDVPLSKRGTSQKIETKQLEISSLERQLATVVDQYMFVENTVRPIKIGLQQVLQNVSSTTVNVDNMAALEKCLVDSCEDMMRLMRATSPPPEAEAVGVSAGISGTIPEDDVLDDHAAGKAIESVSPGKAESERTKTAVVSLESFTSPYNVRITPKKRESYFVPGLDKPKATTTAQEEDDTEDTDFDVMDRTMVKRISSVVVCTSVGKKPKGTSFDDVNHPNHSR